MPNLSASDDIMNHAGFTLFSTIISSTLTMLSLSIALHSLFLTINTYNKIQKKFAIQQASLVARQMLATDIYDSININYCNANLNTCKNLPSTILDLITRKQIKPNSDILILQDNAKRNTLLYYLRKSVLSTSHYALYRDEIVHNSVALAEDIEDFKINAMSLDSFKIISVGLNFINNHKMDFACKLSQ